MSASISQEYVGPLVAAILGWTVAWAVAWAIVWRRRGVMWPLYTGMAAIALALVAVPFMINAVSLLALPAVVVGAIFTIGLAKLIIMAAGRRSVFARSGIIRADAPTARPRGLVE